ncbi:efflux RND transporter permease subunit [Flammeovirgaceae bacterium SG7u.111]|nr:efflux RND transporter permease subunit [Flammeovirgaceae bacterium SG7u.132]WPO35172.1 efflux RND transporter permease subunit [Flammeovirgaceae bacterium SG7u.111]
MKKLIEYFVKYPIWANSIIAALVLFGSVAYFFQIRKSFFPEIDPGTLNVEVVMQGAAPEEMEEGITIKIEEAIKSIEGIDEVRSTSSENRVSVSILLFKDFDPNEVLAEVKNAVDRINSFPTAAERPIVFEVKPRSQAVILGLSGDVDLETLKRFAQDIEDDFLASGVISQVNLSGFPELELSVEVTESDLSRYGLTFDQVAAAVRNNNRDISAGSIKSSEEEILIRSRAKTKSADYLGDIVLRANDDGSNLYLRDVASVKEQFADVPNKLYINGKRAVSFQVNKLAEEDIEEIATYVSKYVDEFNEKHSSMQLIIGFDFFDILTQRLNLLLGNGGVGLLLVLVSLGLFLSLRLSLWVAWGIPASFFGMFIIGAAIGITVNMISLFGMILVIGILVDDGIVIAENIYSHFEKGKTAYHAAIDGTMEVLPSVFTSVMTTIVAFIPLLILEGFEFLQEMAIVVIASLAVSLVEAFLVLPAHLASEKVLVRREESNAIRSALNKAINFMKFKVYGKALTHIMSVRYLYAAVPIAFIMIVLGLVNGGMIKTTFFPSIPFDQFQVEIAFTAGTREDKVEERLREFDTKAWELNKELKKEFDDPDDYISYTYMNTGNTSDGTESGSHAGNLRVILTGMDDRQHISSFDIAKRLQQKIGSIPEAEKFYVSGRNRWGKPVSISLFSKNTEELANAKEDLKSALRDFAELKDVADNAKLGRRELQIELTPRAYFLGLSHADITKQIRQGFFGEEVQRLQKGTDELRVWVRYPEKDRYSLGQLEQMKVKLASNNENNEYPLTELAKYDIGRGLVDIKHFNGSREVLVEAELEDQDASVPELLKKVDEEIIPILKAKYPGLDVEYGGQQKRSTKSINSFTRVIGPLVFTILLLLTLTFRSLPQASMVLMMIPLGVFCAIMGHGIEAKPVSMLSMWGILALSGVIINDAVVFLAKFNSLLQEGVPVKEAAYEAGLSRFRAIVLTSMTTVAGLYPLILEKSFQAQFLIPMAISVAYGVLFGTMFILLIFPVLIVVINDVRRVLVWTGRGIRGFWINDYSRVVYPSREEVEPSVREMKREYLSK